MDTATRDFVRRRADDCCEYCQLRQEHSQLTHHIEHIVAKQHGGSDHAENLALACHRCNLRKGPNLTGIDPHTSEVARPDIGRARNGPSPGS
jgi:5-methylcytosine-specific restriction endonuclease McrA